MLTLPSIQESNKHMELTTCLWFDGDAREVANFYVSIFPESSLGISWIAPADTPGNQKGSKVLVNFVIFGRPFIALNGGPNYHFSEAISFQIPCQDQLMINKYWEILIKDGGCQSRCEWLKDKFGTSWQVTSPALGQYIGGSDPAGAMRAITAMLSMNKIILDDLEQAYESVPR